jgi:cytochrome P450
MIIAGHETTANAIHFCLMELAINPKSQLQVQKDIQTIFGNSTPHTWDYDSSINKLLGGIVGAVLNEQLRLMPPIIAIPKTVPKNNDQEIMIDGKKITLPAGAHINLVTIGLHRNPRYWPSGRPTHSNRPDDLDEFKPERWLVETHASNKQPNNSSGESEEDDDFGGFTGKASHKKLFHPARGSYLPFSEGPRSCLGRRLAQVKIMAVLAVIFQQYSIELAVDEWASDDEVAAMPASEKRNIYKVAQDKARATLRTATSLITLKLHSGSIPIRLVKKGEERFLDIID